jgi:hypothetical protein
LEEENNRILLERKTMFQMNRYSWCHVVHVEERPISMKAKLILFKDGIKMNFK